MADIHKWYTYRCQVWKYAFWNNIYVSETSSLYGSIYYSCLSRASWRTQMGNKPLKMVQYQSGLSVRVWLPSSETSRCGPPLHGRSAEDPIQNTRKKIVIWRRHGCLYSQVDTLLILVVFSVQGCRFCRANKEVFCRHRGSGVTGWLIVFWNASCCSCIRMRLACCRSASRSSAVCRLNTCKVFQLVRFFSWSRSIVAALAPPLLRQSPFLFTFLVNYIYWPLLSFLWWCAKCSFIKEIKLSFGALISFLFSWGNAVFQTQVW